MSQFGDYGAFLREVRRSRGLSQRELADLVGIEQPNLSAYENDRRHPTLDVVNRIVVACGYTLVADAGPRRVQCPLPRVGWFPDEDLPPPDPSDPASHEAPAPAADPQDRGRDVYDALALADAIPWT